MGKGPRARGGCPGPDSYSMFVKSLKAAGTFVQYFRGSLLKLLFVGDACVKMYGCKRSKTVLPHQIFLSRWRHFSLGFTACQDKCAMRTSLP
uniref:Uncharacterized protein n=1 Tax=Arundo donax TaxID=35708 RepID=A0A0A8YRX5_ARUDO